MPYHTVELFVKSTTERANRWKATGPSTRVVLTGIEVAADGELAPWVPLDVNVLIYGDSITEGAGASDAQTTSWPAQLARLLAANGGTDCWAVVNAGISGNRLLHDGRTH